MEIVYSKQSFKDYEKLKQYPALLEKAKALVELLKNNPFETPPAYEKLLGFENVYSRRINIQHRLVYEVRKEENTVVIIRMWTHYEK
ncbi:MAG: Txe/YoeB family addiction module toxin [Bacilli bacterium]|nr:Txe/YoeB family addiction module toxin [Bacilli bacterium]